MTALGYLSYIFLVFGGLVFLLRLFAQGVKTLTVHDRIQATLDTALLFLIAAVLRFFAS